MLRMRDRRVTTRTQHKHVEWVPRELGINSRLQDVMNRKLLQWKRHIAQLAN
jgi:hypothetical protein